jgi:6-pyruvoyltetrahydropterin/6-carboxytetrahydropterin synthase
MYELTVKTHFAAAHRLAMVGGKCENLHGHNWKIEVSVTGKTLDAGGVLLDFGVLKKELAKVMERLDHKFLNEEEAFQCAPPSSENIARFVAVELGALVNDGRVRVSRVAAWESEDSSAAYFPE